MTKRHALIARFPVAGARQLRRSNFQKRMNSIPYNFRFPCYDIHKLFPNPLLFPQWAIRPVKYTQFCAFVIELAADITYHQNSRIRLKKCKYSDPRFHYKVLAICRLSFYQNLSVNPPYYLDYLQLVGETLFTFLIPSVENRCYRSVWRFAQDTGSHNCAENRLWKSLNPNILSSS